jgi:hypothetical protein
VTRLKWKLDSVGALMEDRCTVCAKCTVGSEIFWTHLMVLLGDEAQEEAQFSPFRDNANLSVR